MFVIYIYIHTHTYGVSRISRCSISICQRQPMAYESPAIRLKYQYMSFSGSVNNRWVLCQRNEVCGQNYIFIFMWRNRQLKVVVCWLKIMGIMLHRFQRVSTSFDDSKIEILICTIKSILANRNNLQMQNWRSQRKAITTDSGSSKHA